LDRHIEAVPGIRGGRPRIAGSRITADVVINAIIRSFFRGNWMH
jgi:uncharacterized protein (DUF433 family)